MDTDVLIIGAGPTGLVLALWLTAQGVRVRIVDKTAGPGTTSRALGVQARTLELYRQMNLSKAVIDAGHRAPAVNLWVAGRRAARIPLMEIGEGLTPYPFVHLYPQDRHEALLVERLEQAGVTVERRSEVVALHDRADRIEARLRRAEGDESVLEARYVAGCDGARSIVRRMIGAAFPGGTYPHLFYVADVDSAGPTADGELHVDLDSSDFVAVFPLDGEGRARLIGTVRGARADRAEGLTFDDVGHRAIETMKVQVTKVNWFSTYRVHHRVTDRFRKGRAFLLGDAAHIHSPVGAQGMNTGIGDAINLAWKLAAVVASRAPESILDSYEAERRPFARRLVRTTDQAFNLVTAQGPLGEILRTGLAPAFLPMIAASRWGRDFAFRTVSQIGLNYRGGPLSRGEAGKVRGGDRLPWVRSGDGVDNCASLGGTGWQAHVYGEVRPGLLAWCKSRRIPLSVIPWTEGHVAAGLAQDGFYLLRPDTYVGLAEPSGEVGPADAYCNDLGLNLG
jgi:2-polyprenyl-6-methoxyphenol hydroxylase-like FAD-dependent oxidoreductase